MDLKESLDMMVWLRNSLATGKTYDDFRASQAIDTIVVELERLTSGLEAEKRYYKELYQQFKTLQDLQNSSKFEILYLTKENKEMKVKIDELEEQKDALIFQFTIPNIYCNCKNKE